MSKYMYYGICLALSLTSASILTCAHDKAILIKIHNACKLLGVSAEDAAVPHDMERIQVKYKAALKHYTKDAYQGPEELRLQALNTLSYAFTTLREHSKEIVYVLTSSKFAENKPITPPKQSFSQAFISSAIHIIQDKHSIWQPTLDHMRCYRWHQLIDAIHALDLEDVKKLLVANPYLCTMNTKQERNPHLNSPTENQSQEILKAKRLTITDLVNMNDCRTDALSEVLTLLHDPLPTQKDQRKHAQSIHDILVLHGAVARFVSVSIPDHTTAEYDEPSAKDPRHH